VLQVLPRTESYWIDIYGQVALGGKPVRFENYSRELDKHFEVLAYSLQEGQFATVFTDITERVRVDETLRQYATDLEASNEELDAFAHTVAHDLKNPLAIIVGNAEVLENDHALLSSEELQKHLRVIAQSGRKTSNIIDELLLLATARKMEVKARALDMANIVAEALQRLTYMIAEYQAEILLPDAWPMALGYGPWIEEVWVNYLSNAIKYGGQPPRVVLGSDTVANTQPRPSSLPHPSMVRFWVRDNGDGLTPEDQVQLFTPFTQLHRVRAQGHGLGLSIVQRIVEQLDGQVGAESRVGEGSLFSFTLPAAVKELYN
jgi:signal transduction histidine kinase